MPNFNKHAEEQQTEQVTMSKKNKVDRPHAAAADADAAADAHAAAAEDAAAQAAAVQQPKLKVNLVHQTSSKASTGSTENTVRAAEDRQRERRSARPGNGNPAPAAPAGTPKPACANPNVEATVTNPASARVSGIGERPRLGCRDREVEVTVGPSGNLIGVKVYKSSSNMAIDQAALRAARQSTYSPKLVDCAARRTGDYLFRVDFQPD